MKGKLTDEGQDDKEGAQVHGVGVGQILELDPHLVEEAERLFLRIHPDAATWRKGGILEEDCNQFGGITLL